MDQVTITKYEGYVEYCFCGTFDDESIYQTFDDLWTAADYEFTHNELYDYGPADFTQLTGAVIRKIAQLRRRLNTDMLQRPIAMLVNTDLLYGLLRMVNTLNEELNSNMRVFRDRDEAVAWVSSEKAPPS